MIKAGTTALLPQYEHSDFMYERFLNAALLERNEVLRNNEYNKIKTANNIELNADNLIYFSSEKANLEADFLQDLSSRITEEKAIEFCGLIANYWYDGRAKRTGLEINQLMASIENYLIEFKTTGSKIKILNPINGVFEPSFEPEEIEAILECNKQMTYHYFHKWISDHVHNDLFGLGDVFCRRGISIAELPEDRSLYLENSYINSYSLALSVPEQFTEINKNLLPVFINQRYSLLENRILFFSPFIPKMDVYQIELGVIPHWNNLKWFSNGKHGGINEYQIDTEVDYTAS